MSEQKVKENAEQMEIKIIEYLHHACESDEEMRERLLELATSYVTASLDWDKPVTEIIKDIDGICKDIRDLAIFGAIRYKSGNEENVKKIFYD